MLKSNDIQLFWLWANMVNQKINPNLKHCVLNLWDNG